MPLLIYRLPPVWESPQGSKVYQGLRRALELGYRGSASRFRGWVRGAEDISTCRSITAASGR